MVADALELAQLRRDRIVHASKGTPRLLDLLWWGPTPSPSKLRVLFGSSRSSKSAAATMNVVEANEYEAQRQAQIQENQRKMLETGLLAAAKSMRPTPVARVTVNRCCVHNEAPPPQLEIVLAVKRLIMHGSACAGPCI